MYGPTHTAAADLDIDRRVRLSQALGSGGASWSPERKTVYCSKDLNVLGVRAAEICHGRA